MAIVQLLQLGNPRLYEVSTPVSASEKDQVAPLAVDLHDTLMDFRRRYGAGRAIAAPQIGVMKRVLYLHIDRPVIFVNPHLEDLSPEMMTVWDDCMCFPDLLVKVRRHRSCRIGYRDEDWNDREMRLTGDLSELLQHEYDHLDGILAVSRAVDHRSFAVKSQRGLLADGHPHPPPGY
jgi:peptide deformylase